MFLKDYLNDEAEQKFLKNVKMENELDRNSLIYKTGNKKKDKTYDFQKCKTIKEEKRDL